MELVAGNGGSSFKVGSSNFFEIKVDFALITPLPLTIKKGSIISVEFPEIQKIMDGEKEKEILLKKTILEDDERKEMPSTSKKQKI